MCLSLQLLEYGQFCSHEPICCMRLRSTMTPWQCQQQPVLVQLLPSASCPGSSFALRCWCPACTPVQALAQRSDHLAVIAAFNAWTAARAAGGRGAGADFARQHFLSDQVGWSGVPSVLQTGGGGGLGVCWYGVLPVVDLMSEGWVESTSQRHVHHTHPMEQQTRAAPAIS